jgi:CO/xanthine dehydrogenase Mo-binding subunit
MEQKYSVDLSLEKDGSLEIRTNAAPSFNDIGDVWRRIAQDVLSVEKVSILPCSTLEAPDAGPLTLSNTVTTLTKLVESGCQAIRRKRFRESLPIKVSRTIRPAKVPAWPDCQIAGEDLIDANVFLHPGFAAAVSEVEIYPGEWEPRIRELALAVDGGKILDKEQAERSLRLASLDALAWATGREVSELGNPSISIEFIESSSNPRGNTARGIGELPYSCIPASYVQALSQALDETFTSIPLRPEEIYDHQLHS